MSDCWVGVCRSGRGEGRVGERGRWGEWWGEGESGCRRWGEGELRWKGEAGGRWWGEWEGEPL